MSPRLGIVQQFLAAAGITIIGMMGVLAYWVTERVEASVVRSAVDEGAVLMGVFLGPSVQDLTASSVLSTAAAKRLDELFNEKLAERVKRIKIWLPDGTIAYSTEKELVGKKLSSPRVDAAFAGHVSGALNDLDGYNDHLEPGLQTPLIEIYAPLRRAGTSDIIAVGEMYNNGQPLVTELRSVRFATVGIVGAVCAPMMVLLFLIVRHASSTIIAQQQELIRKVTEAEALANQNDRLRRVADEARVEAASSNERLLSQIGQDLHDGPIQLLSLLVLKLSASTISKPKSKSGAFQDEHELTSRILTEVRNISTGLVLPELKGLTPAETIQLAVNQHATTTGTAVECQIEPLPDAVGQALKVCLFRIVQEGLNNAFHHAQGKGQRVKVFANEKFINVAVSDSGPGQQMSNGRDGAARVGLGLPGLRNRVEAFRGSFEMEFQPGRGTEIRAELPISPSP